MKRFRLWISFASVMAAVYIGVFLLTGILLSLGFHLGLIDFSKPNPLFPTLTFTLTIFTGALALTLLISRYFFEPLHQLILALKQVAGGDFHIQLPENSKWSDIQEMNENFNRMVKELNSIQLIQSDFIQNVSHEIKTPLAAVEGYVALLAASPLSQEQKEYTDRILESSRRLTALTGNILLLSKLENQQIAPERKVFLLDEQIRRCILSMEPLWSAKDLLMDIDLQEAAFLGCEELLAQVWSNLISNAIKYTPKGGTITVCLLKLNDDIQVTVRDSGIGMSEEVQRHIFDKFYQADRSRSTGGNGLGLALVRRILTLCGGEIHVKSQPDQGSLFTVHLVNSAADIP